MKKEGTGKPREPDIVFDADVRMRELCFESVPISEVRFRGNTGRDSLWESRRKNLPDEVREGVVYSNGAIRLRIASEATIDRDPRNSLDPEDVNDPKASRARE